MAKAYIRTCIHPGFEKKIRDKLRKDKDVISAEITAGEQDLMVLVQGASFEDILNFVIAKIRSQEGVKVTWTNFVLD